MEVVIADEDLANKLPGLKTGIAIKNPNGRIMGIYKPMPDTAHATHDCPFSEEELAAIEAEPGGLTLEEIWTRLGRTK